MAEFNDLNNIQVFNPNTIQNHLNFFLVLLQRINKPIHEVMACNNLRASVLINNLIFPTQNLSNSIAYKNNLRTLTDYYLIIINNGNYDNINDIDLIITRCIEMITYELNQVI
jgi:hypothetical protein